jgi:hypothetical protein
MAGIDKIEIQTTDFQLLDINNRDVWGYKANFRQGIGGLPIYSDAKGNKLEANNLYHQSKKTGVVYDVNIHGLKMHFNPSKKHHPFNLIGTGEDLDEYLKAIQLEASQLLKTNIFNCNVTRFDLAKNRALKHPLPTYHNAFNLLKGKRQEKREQPDGVYFGNKSHTTIFYNKKEELAYQNIIAITPDNFMRGEVRLTKNDAVERYVGVKTLQELVKIPSEALNEHYNSYLTKVIFNRANVGDQIRIDFEEEIQFFKQLKEQRKKAYFGTWLSIQSVEYIMQQFGSIDNLKLFLRMAGENRMSIDRHIKKVQEYIVIKGIIDTASNKLTDVALLEELKIKFVA